MGLNILLSCLSLDLSGVPTYTLALYNELIKRGHRATVFSVKSGPLSGQMDTITSLDGIGEPDAIIAQSVTCAVKLREAFPKVFMVFSAHGVIPAEEQNPSVKIDYYTAINEDARENLVFQGVNPSRLEIVRDFVDTERFKSVEPTHSKIEQVLYVSNFKKWRTYARVEKSCRELGVILKAVGSPYGRTRELEMEINKSDLVISTARGVLEAMSCGRPVVSFDQMHGDGYLTPNVYLESRTRNFAGEKCRYTFEKVPELIEQINRYNPEDGLVNRNLILKYHNVKDGAEQLLNIIKKG